MPQRVVCSKCGIILYEGETLRSPQDIMYKTDDHSHSHRNEVTYPKCSQPNYTRLKVYNL